MKFLLSLSRAQLSIPVVSVVPGDLSCDNVASVFSNYTSQYRELLMTCTSLGIECVLSECVQCAAQENYDLKFGLNVASALGKKRSIQCLVSKESVKLVSFYLVSIRITL